MSKGKDRPQEVQFVYEEDDSKALTENPAEVLSDDELSGLEFAAATVIAENPLLGTQQESDELNQEYSEAVDTEKALELSEDAKNQRTATVLHIDRSVLEKSQKKAITQPEIKIEKDISIEHQLGSADKTRDSIKPQSLQKVAPRPQVAPAKNIAPVKEQQSAAPLRPAVSLVEDESVIERIHQIETHAEVRIALAEFKAEFLAEHLGEAKALEYQIKQLLKPLAKTNNEAMIKQVKKIFSLLEEHSKGTIDLVKNKAQAEKIVKPTQEKANKILAATTPIKKAS